MEENPDPTARQLGVCDDATPFKLRDTTNIREYENGQNTKVERLLRVSVTTSYFYFELSTCYFCYKRTEFKVLQNAVCTIANNLQLRYRIVSLQGFEPSAFRFGDILNSA